MIIEAIAFEGGGSTGIAHQGGLEVLQEQGLLHSVKYFIGSSAGSFPAAALACNASVSEIKEILSDTDFSKFLDNDNFFKDCYRFYTKFGWYKGDYVEKWYGNVLQKIIGNSDITFLEAYQRTSKTLVITTVDITTGELIYMSRETTPHLQIKKAVRRSTALPLVYKPDIETIKTEIIENDETTWKDLDHYYIDGGILDNFPIDYFDKIIKPDHCIGFKLISHSEFSGRTNPYINILAPTAPHNLSNYLMRIMIMMTNQSYRYHVSRKDWDRTVKINIKEHSIINFDMSEEEKEDLINEGRKGVLNYLENTNK